ncbi:hypothetical protein ETB97_001916 [Aspergillus alliaceus]|uniref:Transcription factor domain-containing protein n=1 Tax=Petromyces alliaceus TaxID=209559 RepID=A0A8H6AFB7_PETAA|nr:hypothetical protein ETB97_001916 [Aspergillus burnettii]
MASKRKGLEKALHQIEQAIKRPNPDALESNAAQKIISSLQDLLNKTQGHQLQSETDDLSDTDQPHNSPSPRGIDTGDNLTLDDAENPLQLLARASDLQLSPTEECDAHKWRPLTSSQPAEVSQNSSQDNASAAKSFFAPVKANLDLGPDMDPVDLGLVTLNEAESLFALSVEIVLAFMVNVPWMAPGNYLGDDDTCFYLAMALAIALDLSLNKIVLPSTSFDSGVLGRLAKADCIDATRALHMDGFDDVDPSSEWGQRLLRRRERTWIALFVLERGACLARGRSYTVPLTALIESCDRWHVSNFADSRDGPMNSMAVLRRNLDDLFKKVKSNCDSYQIADAGSEAAQTIKTMIESFYDRWYETWAPAIGEGQSSSLPPYVEILVTHTRLSTYGGVINHPTAPLEVKRFFRAAGLSSALNVMRAAIQGESRLKSMPNNTVIMISFAACSALSLSVVPTDTRSSLAPSVRHLIEETAGVLERIGATPNHRSGASVLYGRYLRELVRRGSGSLNFQYPNEPGVTVAAEMTGALPPTLGGYSAMPPASQPPFSPFFWSEPLQFSAMSDGQIIDAVNRAGIAFGTGVPDIPLDDLMSWDWLDIGNVTDFGL